MTTWEGMMCYDMIPGQMEALQCTRERERLESQRRTRERERLESQQREATRTTREVADKLAKENVQLKMEVKRLNAQLDAQRGKPDKRHSKVGNRLGIVKVKY